jgi:NADH-quinone oxidoreductase subunit L
MTDYAWLVPALPFVATFLALATGRRVPRLPAVFTIGATAASTVLAIAMLPSVLAAPSVAHVAATTYTPTGSVGITVGTYVDGLSGIVAAMVCGVALLVQIFSIAYLHGDRRYSSYTAFIALFTAAMLLVVLASDLLELYVGWEVMGLCSYLLVGHYWESRRADLAAIKAFVTTRIGDVPFLFGIFVIGTSAGSFSLTRLGGAGHSAVVAGTLLLVGGVMGKSAQFPLQTWLPDAMAGPTPVSALIHAATMVAAGVYVVARLYPLFASSGTTLDLLAVVAAVTMLLSALAALAQDDLKRVLAWSTVSQLGYMTGGLAVGGYQAAVFHLLNHAAFKALLFLAAGSVLHAVGTNLMSEMGGLWRRMPLTFATFVVGALALSGLPPFSGAFSKDAVLAAAYDAGFGSGRHVPVAASVAALVYVVGLVTVVLTAVYSTRMVVRTFLGPRRGTAQLHEAPPAMAGPLVVLAVPSLALGVLANSSLLPSWLPSPVAAATKLDVAWAPLGIAAVLVLAGIGAVGYWYVRHPADDPVVLLPPALARTFERGLWFDDLYRVALVRPVLALGRRTLDTDRVVVDGAVDGAGRATRLLAALVRFTQSGNVQQYATGVFVGVVVIAVALAAS